MRCKGRLRARSGAEEGGTRDSLCKETGERARDIGRGKTSVRLNPFFPISLLLVVIHFTYDHLKENGREQKEQGWSVEENKPGAVGNLSAGSVLTNRVQPHIARTRQAEPDASVVPGKASYEPDLGST